VRGEKKQSLFNCSVEKSYDNFKKYFAHNNPQDIPIFSNAESSITPTCCGDSLVNENGSRFT
jgi:hypothetical protein